jgi:hypothetical protein
MSKKYITAIILSILLSAIWLNFSHDFYLYNHNFLNFGQAVVYPFIAWLIGLVLLFFIYEKISRKASDFLAAFMLTVLIYWLSLLVLETFSFHVLDIKNLATDAYPGLPLCDCLHAPRWMQATYFVLGPFYLFSVNLVVTNKLFTNS